MALDGCAPCCDPSQFAKSVDSYRQAELIILCDILAAVQGGGGAGNPAAPNRSIQFNNGGVFGGNANFIFDIAGNVGLGTGTPNAKLDVVGRVLFEPIETGSLPEAVLGVRLQGALDGNLGGEDTRVYIHRSGFAGLILGTVASGHGAIQGSDIGSNIDMVLQPFGEGVGIGGLPGVGQLLHVHGDGTIDGKLTVTGAIDPTHLYLTEQVGDPASVANQGILYTKAVTGVTQLFYEADDATVYQLTPSGPSSPDTSVQFNSGGAFGGTADFTFDNAVKLLSLNGRTVFVNSSPTTGNFSYSELSTFSAVAAGNTRITTSKTVGGIANGDDATAFNLTAVGQRFEGNFAGGITYDASRTHQAIGSEHIANLFNFGGTFNSTFNLISGVFYEPVVTGVIAGTVNSLSAFFQGDIQIKDGKRIVLGGNFDGNSLVTSNSFFTYNPTELQLTIGGVGPVMRWRGDSILVGGTSELHAIGGFNDFTFFDVNGVSQTFRNNVIDGGATVDGPVRSSGLYIQMDCNTNAANTETVAIVGDAECRFDFPSIGLRGIGGGTANGDNYGVQGFAIQTTTGINYGVHGIAANGVSNFAGFFEGNVKLANAGDGIHIQSGANATVGTATLAGGTVTVSTTKVTANSLIFLTVNGGTLTNLGSAYEDKANRVAGTSFDIKSTNILDAADVVWWIVEPS